MKTDDIEELMLSNGITGFSMAYMEAGHSLQSFCVGYKLVIKENKKRLGHN